MNQPHLSQIESLFDRAVEIPDPIAREAYLQKACSGDEPLLSQVRRLLRSFDSWTSRLQLPVAPFPRCGAYQCIEPIGAGGMGSVFRARRADGQYDQEVAIKFLRGALRGDSYRSRFLAERQILARLNHPNIARLLDGGVTADDEPFLVMELVEGGPIDTYCDRQRLPIPARLSLFHQVLDAVDYAHRNLIIHRDLKPANIFVDREGSAKLLDFGTSKLVTADAELTQPAAFTPAYASPEQLRGEPVATTSDVFSLGVVLYLLLTGSIPFSGSYLSNLDRAINEAPPRTPDSIPGPDQAAARSRSLPQLRRELSGDLAAILAKALAHDPDRRYPSVAAFADDLHRYSSRRPVLARRPQLSYVLGRAIRRHYRLIAVAATFLVCLTGAAAFSLQQARLAKAEAAHALAANRFLVEIFEIPLKDATSRRDITVRELLQLAELRIPPLLGGDPAVAADVSYVLANGFYWQGDAAKGRALAEQSLHTAEGAGDVPRQALALARASLYSYVLNQFDRASSESQRSISLWNSRPRSFTPYQAATVLHDSATTLLYIRPFDGSHRPYLEQAVALARRNHKDVPPAILSACLHKLAESYINVDRRYNDAKPLLLESIAINRADPSRASLLIESLHSYGRVNRMLGNFAEDEKAQREANEQSVRIFGNNSFSAAHSRALWAQSLLGVGRLEEAHSQAIAALATSRLTMPQRASSLLWTSLSASAHAACLTRRFRECEALSREAIDSLGLAPNPDDLRLTDAEALLGLSLAGQGRRQEATPLLARSSQRNLSLHRKPLYADLLKSFQ